MSALNGDSDSAKENGERCGELGDQLSNLVQTQPTGWRREKWRLKEEIQSLRQAERSIESHKQTRGSPLRDVVVGCRVTAEHLEAMDMLVEAGIRATRSEAAAWFIGEGIRAHRSLLGEVRATVSEIRELRAKAQARARQQDGDHAP